MYMESIIYQSIEVLLTLLHPYVNIIIFKGLGFRV